jgi:2-keto-4-pentenoate hydratase/2-oxohepta-3-ene-1,7-dioic acid hydratase in catechol pathway
MSGGEMRLATVATDEGPRAAAAREGEFVVLPFSVREILEEGEEGRRAVQNCLDQDGAPRLAPDEVRFLAPVPDPKKIICLGLNYRDHAAESGAPIPKDPILFSKYATSLTGHEQPVVLPPVSEEVDYEAELVVVIGRGGKGIAEADAMKHVAGYSIGHDVSARDWQLKKDGKQWMVGKTFDTFAPVGPLLVTADEVPDPHRLGIRLRLNGATMQDGNTDQMIFNVPYTVSFLSRIFTLEPGDLIFTGTPPGVGFARKPPVFLKAGDVVEIEIDGLGLLRNPVVQG